MGAGAGSAVGSEAQSQQESAFDDAFFDLDPDSYYAQEINFCGVAPPHVLLAGAAREQDASPWPSDTSRASGPFAQAFCETGEEAAPDPAAEKGPEAQVREALLTRHFVEVISPWLDVFDMDKYFSHTVPVNSLRSRLLRDTILATSARQLGNKRRESALGGHGDELASFTEREMQNHDLQVDWPYEAASFYDRAIRQMVSSLQYIGTTRNPPWGCNIMGFVLTHPQVLRRIVTRNLVWPRIETSRTRSITCYRPCPSSYYMSH